MRCPLFPNCQEVALIRSFDAERLTADAARLEPAEASREQRALQIRE